MSKKSSKSTTKVELPPELQAASQDGLNYAAATALIPSLPNRGMTTAAFTPQQIAAMRGTNAAARAFGLPTGDIELPGQRMETTVGGVKGYTAAPIYDDTMRKSIPRQLRQSIDALFANKETGGLPEPLSKLLVDKYGPTGQRVLANEAAVKNKKKKPAEMSVGNPYRFER